MKKLKLIILTYYTLSLGVVSQSAHALDSYRYLHVTIDTPWSIFLFLLTGIFAPFVLMAVLIWRYSTRYKSDEDQVDSHQDSEQHL